jgi:D-glycero-D-manno-heptose 1,7-bisphosphate phosphatase
VSTRRRPVAFLDRDGTLNVKTPEGGYVSSPDQFVLLPAAREALRLLAEHNVATVVITNQRGIALGHMRDEDVAAINERLVSEAMRAGGNIDAIYVCPHDEGECDCRKPQLGLFHRAFAEDPTLDPDRAVVIGDAAVDIEAGLRLGLPAIRVGDRTTGTFGADHVAADVAAAVRWALPRFLRFDTSDGRG